MLLADRLEPYRGQDAVVLALPRGGVPVAAKIAARLIAPLDLLLVRKIGLPQQPELAMGAVVDGGEPIVVRNSEVLRYAGVSRATFNEVYRRELAELERRRRAYLGDRRPVDVTDRTVIVVDDGIATGATMRAGVRALKRRRPSRIIVAVPVAAADTAEALRRSADEVICLSEPTDMDAIGQYYRDFSQTSDEEVMALLRERKGASSARA